MNEARETGWWLPEPRPGFYIHDRDEQKARSRRFRYFGVMTLRLWMATSVAFGGLLGSDPHLSKAQVFFGALLFAFSGGLLLCGVLALLWSAG